jgi:hypothetical protein
VAEAGEEGDVYEKIHELRTVAKDYEAARALALQFFADHLEKDFLRHQVHYEYAMM